MEENQLRLSVLVAEVNDGLSLNRFGTLRHERNNLLRALAMVVVPVEKISMLDRSRNPKMHESKYWIYYCLTVNCLFAKMNFNPYNF